MLGGGLSYMSAQYGWAASSALEYEVVLANGTIVTASDTENADLARALRGGGNNCKRKIFRPFYGGANPDKLMRN